VKAFNAAMEIKDYDNHLKYVSADRLDRPTAAGHPAPANPAGDAPNATVVIF
jgi:hypothetical protein